jgi:hypothetical protein
MPKHYQMSFDLISDLYVDDWSQPINWSAEPTSLIAVVAGDISKDLDHTVWELQNISKCYKQVMFIDGDLEHASDISSVQQNRSYLSKKLSKIENLTFMHEQVLIINNVAFLAANLWWAPQCSTAYLNDDRWMQDMGLLSLHHEDLDYLRCTVQRLQQPTEVTDLVMVSHAVPSRELIASSAADTLCSDASDYIEIEDIKHKITHWCFGHCVQPMKTQIGYYTYVSNPRGKPETSSGLQYHPMRVTV